MNGWESAIGREHMYMIQLKKKHVHVPDMRFARGMTMRTLEDPGKGGDFLGVEIEETSGSEQK